ncbi:ribonuclease H protein [Trifolium medium]|uniref:Ribonuclease H protein n=1 Tax=Trifolium medium TaxID=97028 RepID=A0A392PRJ2_9FABA|nr:ribonuclease H protein [Trifolium medium]
MGFQKVELNVDSEVVVRVIKSGKTESAVGVSLTKEIARLMAMEWEVEVTHMYRVANRCADVLANEGCTMNFNMKIYEECPEHLNELVLADSLGLTTPR